jgi:hypothetical protein
MGPQTKTGTAEHTGCRSMVQDDCRSVSTIAVRIRELAYESRWQTSRTESQDGSLLTGEWVEVLFPRVRVQAVEEEQ